MSNTQPSNKLVFVDVIIPVHNAEETIEEAVRSAMHQEIPSHLSQLENVTVDLAVCCYNDGSSDESWCILCRLKEEFERTSSNNDHDQQKCSNSYEHKSHHNGCRTIHSKLYLGTDKDRCARGAGYARNQAVALRPNHSQIRSTEDELSFLCLLDSDDIMRCTRVAEQLHTMLSIPQDQRGRTLLGCTFNRDPPDSTWHYSQWANGLTDERLMLERYREVTVLQPTWFLSKKRFKELGGYIEAPDSRQPQKPNSVTSGNCGRFRLIHPSYDTPQSLRLAEDLRFFHEHLCASGLLRLHRTPTPLVTYRHRVGQSQSSQTPRKLLLQLRVLAVEKTVLRSDPRWLRNDGSFVVWGAGRDGKDFVKALSSDLRHRVACFVDVDYKKISARYYVNKDIGMKIPIVHFSMLAKDSITKEKLLTEWEQEVRDINSPSIGRIDKSKAPGMANEVSAATVTKKRGIESKATEYVKRRRLQSTSDLDSSLLSNLPVVVCVAMYRTHGVLERNVKSIGRTEGKDLWYFS